MSVEEQLAKTLDRMLGLVDQLSQMVQQTNEQMAQLRKDMLITQAELIVLKQAYVMSTRLTGGQGLDACIRLLRDHPIGPDGEQISSARKSLLMTLTS